MMVSQDNRTYVDSPEEMASRDNHNRKNVGSSLATIDAATVNDGARPPHANMGAGIASARPRSSHDAALDRNLTEVRRSSELVATKTERKHGGNLRRPRVQSAPTKKVYAVDRGKDGPGVNGGGGGSGGGGGGGGSGGGSGGDGGGGVGAVGVVGGVGDVGASGVGGGDGGDGSGVGVVVVGGVGEGFLRFGSDQGTIPRLPSTLGRQSWPSSLVTQFSSVGGSSFPTSRASTTSSIRRSKPRKGERGGVLAAAREAKEAGDLEARQALARAEPNLFPEICSASLTDANDEKLRGRRGWLAKA